MTPLTTRFEFISVGKMKTGQYTPTQNGHGTPLMPILWNFSSNALNMIFPEKWVVNDNAKRFWMFDSFDTCLLA